MDSVRTTRDGDVCVIELDDGKANALGPPVLEALGSALDAAESDANAVVIVGRPDRFSAGFDLSVMRGGGADAAAAMVAGGGRLFLRFLEYPLPIVVGCTGHALAAGAIALLTADWRVGARGEYKIGLNETAIGMTLPSFGVEFARARLSKRYLDRAVVHAEIFDPEGAFEAGYLDELVTPESVLRVSLAAAERLGGLPRSAFRNNKRQVNAAAIDAVAPHIEANVRSLMGA